ncbi:hypothetical protein [Thermogutta terrifontis]|uniref:hypothetical protein n=1 Tax=Thermogutta terrifontis TaxID=1331910 RepID=UPI000BA870A4|nr:hypothetical protein [Thermogutta terrifontis]
MDRRSFWRAIGHCLAALGILTAARKVWAENPASNSADRDAWSGNSSNSSIPSTDPEPKSSSAERTASPSVPRLREGTALEAVTGTLRPAGERYVFFSEDARYRLVVLENLALERLLRVQNTYAGNVFWKVWGTVTEFRGQNYLLLKRSLFDRVEAASPSAPP